jgi:hypothetical protein
MLPSHANVTSSDAKSDPCREKTETQNKLKEQGGKYNEYIARNEESEGNGTVISHHQWATMADLKMFFNLVPALGEGSRLCRW